MLCSILTTLHTLTHWLSILETVFWHITSIQYMLLILIISFLLNIRPRLLEVKETWFTHPIHEIYRGEDRPRLGHTESDRPRRTQFWDASSCCSGPRRPCPFGSLVSVICLWVDFRTTSRRKVSLAPQWAGGQIEVVLPPHRHIHDSYRRLPAFPEGRPFLRESPPPPPISHAHIPFLAS